MNSKQPAPAPMGITPSVVYYILFRHKWLIGIVSLVALVAALLTLALWPLQYVSEARLLIKYVKETRPPQQTVSSGDSQVTMPDSRGENIINSEIEILTSLNSAEEVATNIGAAKILAKAAGGSNEIQAAILIQKGLIIPVESKRSDVIEVVFTHPDPEIASLVLGQLIEVYENRHREIHRPEFNEYLNQEIERIKVDQREVDRQLRETKSNYNIITLEDSKKRYNDRVTDLQAKVNDASAEQAGLQESIRQMEKLIPKPAAATATNASAQPPPVPLDRVAEYQRLSTEYLSEQAKLTDLMGAFTTNYPAVQIQQAQVAQTEARKKALEQNFPGLTNTPAPATRLVSSSGRTDSDPVEVLNEEIIKSDALNAKIQEWTNQLARVQAYGAGIISQEGLLTELQNQKTSLDSQLAFFTQKLQESKANETLGSGNSNISVVETPTPGARTGTMKLYKLVLGIFFGGLALAFGLAFLIELYLDRSLKHPLDVQAKLGLPFFISIPEMNGNGKAKARALKNAKKVPLLPGKPAAGAPVANGQAVAVPAPGQVTLWDDRHNLRPFYETLRDRLMTYFEMINLTHKPKLVAVTSCGSGAGVTSTAAGLASSLSETGEGNVLLVNMNVRDGEAHHFYKGKLACGLDEVLEKGTREGACVQGNLYVAKEHENDDKLPRILPKRFSHLLPKMKASDFDYIIFDMPPVSQISITPRLARFMDMVLLVVESGKTDRDVAQRVAAMLTESKTNVGIVLNKNRSYLPRRLHQEV